MTHDERDLLLRQVHSSFVKDNQITSQAFRPTPKDKHLLSFDDGNRINAERAWQRHNNLPNCTSIGVAALHITECEEQDLDIIYDGKPYPEHVSLSFQNHNPKAQRRIAKKLRDKAVKRGWLFQV